MGLWETLFGGELTDHPAPRVASKSDMEDPCMGAECVHGHNCMPGLPRAIPDSDTSGRQPVAIQGYPAPMHANRVRR
jgi:hypothetical protein